MTCPPACCEWLPAGAPCSRSRAEVTTTPAEPDFHTLTTDGGTGVTYDCGCPCTPTAVPNDAQPGFEHCCCGKVHFVGAGAGEALTAYLAERKARRTREPEYERGEGVVAIEGREVEVAWAFPRID